jgi:Spy/CpxP family protein refolding chaperone
MVLSNQIALGLTDDQLQSLKSLLKATHDSTLDTQVALQRAVETLQRTLDSTRIDEAAALAAADQVMALETAMKKGHLGLMIRVKNLLTPDQQKKLEEMRPPQPPQPPQPPAPPAR